MIDINKSREIETVEEGISEKEKPQLHIITIKTDDEEYLPLNKKDFDKTSGKTKVELEEIKSLLYDLVCKGTIQIEVPQSIPELLLPKRIKEEKEKLIKLKEKFESLVKKWKEDTRFASTVLEMATNPAYQQIIGMGRQAVPLILKQLAKKPEHWFWALNSITGEDPVPENSRGNLPKMTKAWLEWGQQNGYE